jgi:hypothetical protein
MNEKGELTSRLFGLRSLVRCVPVHVPQASREASTQPLRTMVRLAKDLRAGFSFVLGVQNRSFLSFGKASVKASRKRRKKRRKKRREKRRKSVAKVSQKASQKASRKRRKNVAVAFVSMHLHFVCCFV